MNFPQLKFSPTKLNSDLFILDKVCCGIIQPLKMEYETEKCLVLLLEFVLPLLIVLAQLLVLVVPLSALVELTVPIIVTLVLLVIVVVSLLVL